MEEGPATEAGAEDEDPRPVKRDSDLLKDRVLESLTFKLDLRVLGTRSKIERRLRALVQPAQSSEEENGEVRESLVLDEELDGLGVVPVGIKLRRTSSEERRSEATTS